VTFFPTHSIYLPDQKKLIVAIRIFIARLQVMEKYIFGKLWRRKAVPESLDGIKVLSKFADNYGKSV
jgi:hypothetical protein